MPLPTIRRARTLLAAALAIAAAASAGSSVSDAASHEALTASGDLQAYVNAYITKNPGRDSGRYRIPSTAERAAMRAAWRSVMLGDLSAAATTAGPLGYQVVRYTDTATRRVAVLLAERSTSDRRWVRGWGLFAWAPSATNSLLVEVTHPVADVETEDVGVVAFRRARGRALFVAGAHRDANPDGRADVAHRTDTVFHVIHESSVTARSTVFQPHGYADATTPEDVVASRGDRADHLVTDVASELRAAAFTVCLYDGALCSNLAGTTNAQGIVTRRIGGRFLHLEMARRVRTDAAMRDRLAGVVASAF